MIKSIEINVKLGPLGPTNFKDLYQRNPPPSDPGCTWYKRLTWVMAVTSLLSTSNDLTDHPFSNILFLLLAVLSVFLSLTILPKFIFPYLYSLCCLIVITQWPQ